MRHIIVDFEMHPVSREYTKQREICQREIVEFGAVMLDEQYNEVSSFKRYVKPLYVRALYGRIIALTGITASLLEGAEGFREVFHSFLSWCNSFEDDYMVYAWSNSDQEQLVKEMALKNIVPDQGIERLLDNWVDFQEVYCRLVKAEKKLSLDKALDMIGQRYMGHMHDALWDARNTAELFAVSRDAGEFSRRLKAFADTAHNAQKGIITYSLGEIFNFDTCGLALG